VTNWIWLLSAIEGPAVVSGNADSTIRFTEVLSGKETLLSPAGPNGAFSVHLPEGRYRIASGGVQVEQDLVPGGTYSFDLRADSAVTFSVRQQVSGREVVLRVAIKGTGRHRIAVRGDGVNFGQLEKTVELRKGVELVVEFRGRPTPSEPWVALVVPDGDWTHGKEIKGE
jgi:hypothetical protein